MKNSITTTSSFPTGNFGEIKAKVLGWTKQFDTFCFLDNHQYQQGPHSQECILAAGISRMIDSPASQSLEQVQRQIEEKNSWLFGHLSYDLKQDLGFVPSGKEDIIGFPGIMFFEPLILVRFNETTIEISANDPQLTMEEILQVKIESVHATTTAQPKLINRISRDEYIETINKLKDHILRGDCYEINFCQEAYCHTSQLDPIATYQRLAAISPNPFSALYRHHDSWLICASPERFLKRSGKRLISQPIKGTSKRYSDNESDIDSRAKLSESQKDRSENVMIVDLVRNDLSRICIEGTVLVDELFGIYSFPQVHQMISTVSGELKNDITFGDIIRATFPMGSMTGAPKKRVVELIEKYEVSRRGIFSGAVGYISPDGDFDFNVVIRSLLYNAGKGYLSYQVGSGITFYSDPRKEWEECLMKAEAMEKVLNP